MTKVVVITFLVIDDYAGVETSGTTLIFQSPSLSQSVQATAHQVASSAGDPDGSVQLQATITFPVNSETGTWSIVSVDLSGNAATAATASNVASSSATTWLR